MTRQAHASARRGGKDMLLGWLAGHAYWSVSCVPGARSRGLSLPVRACWGVHGCDGDADAMAKLSPLVRLAGWFAHYSWSPSWARCCLNHVTQMCIGECPWSGVRDEVVVQMQ